MAAVSTRVRHTLDLVVVGGGQAGLATARAALRRNLNVVLLERGTAPTGSWPKYYDSLTLFSPARYSALPGLAFQGDPSHFPHRDEVVEYLNQYASLLDVDVSTNSHVTSVQRTPGGYRVNLADGRELAARAIVSAAGSFARPHFPSIPALKNFKGPKLHASAYRAPAPFQGQRVLVVGGGNSAVQIATELTQVADVTIVSREPLRYLPKTVLGKPIQFWHHSFGLDALPVELLPRHSGPRVVDDGTYRSAITFDKPRSRALPCYSQGTTIYFGDDSFKSFDTVLLATGYRPNTEWMRRLGVLTDSGLPFHVRGVARNDPTVGWVGLPRQRTRISAMLRGVGKDANYVVARIARNLRT